MKPMVTMIYMHSAEEANQHQVIHITEAGDYVVSGSLSYGQYWWI